MSQPNNGFATLSLQQTKDLVGDLKPSGLVKKKLGDTPAVEPTIAVQDVRIDNEVFFRVVTSYYYAGEHLQVMVLETKDTDNNTVELSEKLWEYNESIGKFIHKKYINGVKTVLREQTEGYGKPEDVPELRPPMRTQGFWEDQHTCTASGSCCYFGGTMDEPYNHCGKYCGDHESSGGGTPINTCDACCENHDNCLRSAGSRCHCDEILNHCYHLESCPGDSIMGAGIRSAAFFADCDYEQFW
ncbi:hypothetical protein [Halobacillus halophilus]|uniref:hypothetical protein n=1 Tax=Halobacillus halophilus TaxID=1570 RepID=UPI001CD583D9|nr:hypothetical protein [Halobacillus halophilus]MCA1012813.1 hypothetical protein [Halobacillus halophilus]